MISISLLSRKLLALSLLVVSGLGCQRNVPAEPQPNVLIIHTDQWRAQAFGYAGDPNVATPHIDRLAAESANFRNAVSGMPVCTPHRASLMTGQRPLSNGVFMNDVQLDPAAVCLAESFTGYTTGYIGKWHLDGSGRSAYIPPERRQGFAYWKALECTHNYNQSAYYANDDTSKQFWGGYDTFSQVEDAQQYMKERAADGQSFLLMLSLGTPHAPYHTAPQDYRDRYDSASIKLRPNVPEEMQGRARRDLAGYYAHCTAIDDQVGLLRKTLEETGLSANTVLLFTADHGDLLGSHGAYKKQQPYDESIRVPMLIWHADPSHIRPGVYDALINSEDIMPTLLGLCALPVPSSVEGIDYSAYLQGKSQPLDTATLISCVQPFGQWSRPNHGGREYRGIRSLHYTYTRDLNGPWQLFDNRTDPYQLVNRVEDPEYAEIQQRLELLLSQKLSESKDEFLPGLTYVERYNYPTLNERETVPYKW